MCILLIGFMGAGKTTVMKLLHEQDLFFNIPCYDLDEEIEKKWNDTIENLILQKGVCEFREIESELLRILCSKECLISCGGGVVESEKNRPLLEQHTCVYLKAPKELLYQRIVHSNQMRPIVYDPIRQEYRMNDFFELFEKRNELYEKFADIIINTDTTDEDSVIREIVEFCKSKNPMVF